MFHTSYQASYRIHRRSTERLVACTAVALSNFDRSFISRKGTSLLFILKTGFGLINRSVSRTGTSNDYEFYVIRPVRCEKELEAMSQKFDAIEIDVGIDVEAEAKVPS